MSKIVTFGEIMLRLKSPGNERFFQSPMMEATFGGGEANVAVGLARYGLDASFVSLIPKNQIGDACVEELRKHGVDTTKIIRKGSRLGFTFLKQVLIRDLPGLSMTGQILQYQKQNQAI